MCEPVTDRDLLGIILNARGKGGSLSLSRAGIDTLPPQIGELTDLDELDLSDNELTALPSAIGLLKSLTKLDLRGNQIGFLPSSVGELSNLRELLLSDNQLTSLPTELGHLSDDLDLLLDANPWSPVFAQLAKEPARQLLAYLRSLEEGVPQYEAKVLLVGEGEVGKSCLLAALRGEDFIERRPSTHGIEIKQIQAEHPDVEVTDKLKLNFWDFGGQEVYRITHQFFFSRGALYLLVWKPREGREENAVAGWLERIKLRAGDAARVLIVATHSRDRRPELDYPALLEDFGDILVGHCEVDSSDGTGIDQLRERIGHIVVRFEHVRRPWNARWLKARDELLAREDTHITYREFEGVCERYGLDEAQARTLIGQLHTLGHVVYYDLDGLRDFVVLKPEWLTKAMSYVLEDEATRECGGVLSHARLKAIWHDHGINRREKYESKYFPYFLRLMEQYDVSYRQEGEQTSLVTQMVPYERPTLPWLPTSFTDQGQMTLVCKMAQDPPGLVAWLTVRNHRWSTGLHWRSGVFLRDRNGHEALVELRKTRRLTIVVRGGWPSDMMSVLRDGLEKLIEDRWPYLDYQLLVPCPNRDKDGHSCANMFELNDLSGAIREGIVRFKCLKCREDVDVQALLTGFVPPVTPLREQLGAMAARLEAIIGRLDAASEERRRFAAQAAEMTRRVLRASVDEARQGPRLFTLWRKSKSTWDPRSIGNETYGLTLWCEHPGHEHPCGKNGRYEIRQPKDWLMKIGPYVALATKVLKVAVPIAAGAGGLAEETLQKQIKPELEFMEKLTDAILKERERPLEPRVEDEQQPISRAEGAGLREFHRLLRRIDKERCWGDLRAVSSSPTGDVLWVCPEHRKEYDPGLPTVPE